MEGVLFWIFAMVLTVASVLVITRTNPIAAAMALLVAFLAQAGLFALLSAKLAAVIQILVYAGGILVLILFVIMLLDLKKEELEALSISFPKAAVGLAALLGFGVWPVLLYFSWPFSDRFFAVPQNFGGLFSVADRLFGGLLFPFEVLALLLLSAVVGALVLAKRRL